MTTLDFGYHLSTSVNTVRDELDCFEWINFFTTSEHVKCYEPKFRPGMQGEMRLGKRNGYGYALGMKFLRVNIEDSRSGILGSPDAEHPKTLLVINDLRIAE